MARTDSIDAKRTLKVGGKDYAYYSLPAAEKAGIGDLSRLPYSIKVLLENLLRHFDGTSVTADSIGAVVAGRPEEIAFRPGRVLMQDLLAGPCMADLAAMRDAIAAAGGDPAAVNPLIPADLVIDHSLTIEAFATADAVQKNVEIEYQRNRERYEFFRWCQTAFDDFRVVPPGAGIVHQVNLEYLADVVSTRKAGPEMVAFPDTLVGIDSHTPMVNSLGVVGWGVGGIEAQAAMLGQPISMLVPPVVGVELTGALPEGATATDLVLTIVQRLRAHGVVGKFVEFHGAGLDALALADRATISNMAPEYGATCVYFPIDRVTLDYLRFSGRDAARVALVEAYAKAQTLWRDAVFARAGFRRAALRRPRRGRAEPRRAAPAAGPGGARRGRGVVHARPAEAVRRQGTGEARRAGRRHGSCADRRRRGDRRDHELHQYLEPVRHARRRIARPESGGERPQAETLGEDLLRTGLAGGERLSRRRRADAVAGWAGIPARRLRLHHLRRLLRPAARRGLGRGRRGQPGRRGGAVGQPQLRGPHPSAGPRRLPRLAAAGRRLCDRRHRDARPHQGAARRG